MINEIIDNYEITLENVKHIYYSNCKENNNNILFISFAGKIDKYVSSTWFYKQSEFIGNFLFLKNNDENYNSYFEEKFFRLIKYYIDKLKITKLIMYGPSMGGIASLIYGLQFNADIIISIDPNPVNFDYNILLNQIKSYDEQTNYKNKIYINYTFINDFETIPIWTKEIISQLQLKNCITTIQPFRSLEHLAFIPSKEYLINIIKQLDNLNVSNYSNIMKWF